MGLPRTSASGLPMNRVDWYREGMMTTTFMFPSWSPDAILSLYRQRSELKAPAGQKARRGEGWRSSGGWFRPPTLPAFLPSHLLTVSLVCAPGQRPFTDTDPFSADAPSRNPRRRPRASGTSPGSRPYGACPSSPRSRTGTGRGSRRACRCTRSWASRPRP